ncbi:IS5 family transposase [Yinghuangia aomiensis]|uniref:IS5 family transposase n=1 Tax=Yinghuangia aomiensis TaxID=676205 RepID=A0ABP9I7U1_9ACTN
MLERLLPTPACQTRQGGRPEKHHRRDIVDAIRYVVDNGIKWRALPADFPPFQTVFGFFTRWAAAGVVTRIRDQLRRRLRIRADTSPRPVSVILDSQSVKAAETVSRATRGYDPGKKINGRKRHLAVDNRGLLVSVLVTGADVRDADAARDVLWRLRLIHPSVVVAWADSAYAGQLVQWADKLGITLKTVPRPKGAKGFVVLPKRWIVERTNAWTLRARRNVRDYERLPQHSEAHVNWAAIALMTKRLTRKGATATRTAKPWRKREGAA